MSKYTAIKMGHNAIVVELTANIDNFINPEILAAGDDYHEVEMAACDRLDALEAAAATATNAELLEQLADLSNKETEAATVTIYKIGKMLNLSNNDSFQRYMQSEFTYYSNISPRRKDIAKRITALEHIWGAIYHC